MIYWIKGQLADVIYGTRVASRCDLLDQRAASRYDVVETRMVGSELNIFSNNHWRIYQISVGGLLYIYGDLLESPHYPPQVAAL